MNNNVNGNAAAVGGGIEDGDYEWWWRPCDDMVMNLWYGYDW